MTASCGCASSADWRTRPDFDLLLEFNEILTKACDNDPRQRYRSAKELGKDLTLLQTGLSIKRKRVLNRRLDALKTAIWIAFLLAAAVVGTRFASITFKPAEYVPKLSGSAEATDFYNQGRYFYQKNTGAALRQAIDYFQKAVDKDPSFALAHAALASSYCWGIEDFKVDFVKARQHAEKALALDDNLAEAHKARAWVMSKVDWDWPGSKKEFKRAVELAPRDPSVHEWYGTFLGGMGWFDDSIRELKKAEKLDTGLSLSIRMLLGGCYRNARKDELAIRQFQEVIGLETNAASMAYVFLADLYELRHEFSKAIEVRDRSDRLVGKEDTDTVSRRYEELRGALEDHGAAGYWRHRLAWARQIQDSYMVARFNAQLGDTNAAFAALQTEFEHHSAELAANVVTDRYLDNLRSDPRYDRLLRDMRLK